MATRTWGVIFLILVGASTAYMLAYKVESFPPYFFCDEAINGLDADYLIKTGRDSAGVAWPVVFRGLGEYALSATVYFQIPFNYAFGMNEESVRLRTVCTSLFGIGIIAYFMWIWGYRHYAWVPFFVFSVSPHWYLHSRTGFEYITAAVFYVSFFCVYMHALREGKSKWLLLAAVAAAVCFYSYTPARGWIAGSVLLLVLANWRFHWEHKGASFSAVGVGLIMMVPFLKFAFNHPGEAQKRLNAIGFYEFKEMGFLGKITHLAEGYLTVLDPRYWFTLAGTMQGVGERHYIPGLNSIPLWLGLFFAVGVFVIFRSFLSIQKRSFLCFLLAVPLPASLVTVNHERVIAVGALYVIVCIIGIVWILKCFSRALSGAGWVVTVLAVIFSLVYQISFHTYVHTDTAARYADYGFYGTQSGAREVYSWIDGNIDDYDIVHLSQGTFNAPDVMADFYLSKHKSTRVLNVFSKSIWDGSHDLVKPEIWIMSTQEVLEWSKSDAPINIDMLHTLADPAGKPLYEVIKLSAQAEYSKWRSEKIAAAQLRRKTLQVSSVIVGGDHFSISHPMLASGSMENLFKNQNGVVVRVDQINPAGFIFTFSPRVMDELVVTLTHTAQARITVTAVYGDLPEIIATKDFVSDRGDSPEIKFPLPARRTGELRMTVYLPDGGPDASPHLGGIRIR